MPVKFDSLGAGIKRARKKKGITQKEFAEDFRVDGSLFSLTTIRNWEQGISYPEAKTLEALCKYFDCDMDYLFGRIDNTTHDLQFVCDYTGLDEDTVLHLHNLLKDEKTTMFILGYLIRADGLLLKKLVDYFLSGFDTMARTHPYSLIDCDFTKLDRKYFYADLLDALPKNMNTFFEGYKRQPSIAQEMIFSLIWRCTTNREADGMLGMLYQQKEETEPNDRLRTVAEFLASNSEYQDMANSLDLDLNKFIIKEAEDDKNGTNN